MQTQLVVLGAGPGGYAAAFRAADMGMQVTLIDERDSLGGTCLLEGCIPSKALLHVAGCIDEARRLADWGVVFADAAIEVDALRRKKQKVVSMLAGGLDQLARRRKVEVVRARAAFRDSSTLLLEPVEGQTDRSAQPQDNALRFEHCILASGSSPAKIPSVDMTGRRVMGSRAALELADVPETLLVIGGGYIGLELGSVYSTLGSRVTVVEMTDRLLPGADADLVKPLAKRLTEQFEAIYLNTKVVTAVQRQDCVELTLEGEAIADAEATRRFDRVLVAVGRRPNSSGLGLENTDVEIDPSGFVVTDRQQRTADEKILAVGDVAGEPMLAHRAAAQGRLAAEVLAGKTDTFQPRTIPAVVFTDPQIAWAGLSEEQAAADGRRVEVARFPWMASGRAQAVGSTEGMTKWIVDPQDNRLLGCGIVGCGAGELISEAVVAIERGLTAEELSAAIHPHPTFSETLAAAAEVYLGTATDLYRPRRQH